MGASPERWNAWWVLLGAGAILAVGAKENFLIYLPIVWIFLAWVARQRRLGAVAWTAGLLTTLVGFWIAGVIVVATSHAGVDVYDQPTGLGHRLQALFALDDHWKWAPMGFAGMRGRRLHAGGLPHWTTGTPLAETAPPTDLQRHSVHRIRGHGVIPGVLL